MYNIITIFSNSCKNLVFLFAAVLDGHGGDLSVTWLEKALAPAIIDSIDDSFVQDAQSDTTHSNSGVYRPSHIAEVLTDVFSKVDKQLIDHLKSKVTQVHAPVPLSMHPSRYMSRCFFAVTTSCCAQ